MKTHRLAERRLTSLLEIMHCAGNCNLQSMVKINEKKKRKERNFSVKTFIISRQLKRL